MKPLLIIVQAVLAVLLSLVILLQNKGVGLSATFGGSSNVYSSKRSADRLLFNATVVLALLFAANALVLVFVD